MNTSTETNDSPDTTDDATDPVCGMTVVPEEAAATATHDGETYYFCCHGCADSFENDPDSYLESNAGTEVHS